MRGILFSVAFTAAITVLTPIENRSERLALITLIGSVCVCAAMNIKARR